MRNTGDTEVVIYFSPRCVWNNASGKTALSLDVI